MTEVEWLTSTNPAAMLEWLIDTQVARGNLTSRYDARTQRYDGGPSDRKLRLFACACRRAVGTYRWDGQSQGWAYMEDRPEEVVLANGVGPDELPAIDHARLFLSDYLDERSKPAPSVAAAILRDICGNPFRPVTLPPGPLVPCDDFCRKPIKRRIDELMMGGLLGHGIGPQKTAWRIAEEFGYQYHPYDIHKMWRRGQPWGDPCPTCKPGPCPWLTPQVLSLALAAYEERQPDGTLDPFRLALLADALEEAGCYYSERCDKCHGSGTYTVQVRNAGLAAANGYGPATTYSEWRGCRQCGGDHDRKGNGSVTKIHPLLAHLRSPGPHYRGCWAVDLILNKS